MGPRLIADGRVFAGVGLSRAQFFQGPDNETGASACGMCLQVTARMPKFDCALTTTTTPTTGDEWPVQTLVVMVVDVCDETQSDSDWENWDG
eukprot:1965083-Prymnesium_polylepis.2